MGKCRASLLSDGSFAPWFPVIYPPHDMIRVPLTVIVFIYLFVFLGVLAVAGLLEVRRRRTEERRVLQFRLRCAICALEFEDRSSTDLPICPRCGRPNERVKPDTL